MFGTGEMLIIAVVAIIVVDPKKMPDLMKGLGKAINEFKQMSNDVKQSFERESEAADFEKRKAEAEEQLFGKGAPSAPSGDAAADQSATDAAATAETPASEIPPEEVITDAPVTEASVIEPPIESVIEPVFDETLHVEQPPVERAAVFAAEAAKAEKPEAEKPEAEKPEAEKPEAGKADAAPPAETLSETPPPAPEPTSAPSPETPADTLPVMAAETLPDTVSETPPPAVPLAAEPPMLHEEAQPPAAAPPPPPPPPVGDEAVGEGQSGRMSLFGHLQDLRVRLTRCAIGVVVGFLACYAFAGQMLKILMQPMLNALKQSHFIYTVPTEAFFVEMKVGFVAGIFAASPYLFYQLWRFVSPGLYSHERRWIIPIAFFSALCFTCGALFGYFVVFPFGFEFFASYTSDILVFTPKLDEYLDFVLKLLLAFGIVFELPLFLFFLARLGLVSHVGLRKKRKYAVLASFVVAAALTPPDAVSQTMMAVPLCILYEVGIWVAYFFGKKPKPEPKDEPADGAGAAA